VTTDRRPSLLVPTLALIASAGCLRGADNLAPVITIPVSPDSININSGYPLDEDDTASEVIYSLSTVQANIWDFDPATAPADFVAAAGIAVTEANGGTWAYTEDKSATPAIWTTITGVGYYSPFTLPLAGTPDPALRFTPANSNFNGTATLRWRAWDDSDASGPYVNIYPSYFGSDSVASADDRGFEIGIAPTNDRPTSFGSVILGFGGVPGETVETTAGAIVEDAGGQDVDGDTLGIVITGQNVDPQVAWEWFNGEVWVAITGTAEDYALPLDAGTPLRVTIPVSATPSSSLFGLSVRMWDGTYGSSGTNFDLALADGEWSGADQPAWSSFASTLDIEVYNPTNFSPTWNAAGPFALSGVAVGDPDPSGTWLSDLLGNAIDDYDGDPDGIAIVGATGAGTWQIGEDIEGVYYSDLGSVSANAAILLDSLDSRLIRYLPGSSNETATLTIRAWDQTSSDTDLTNPVDGGHVSLATRTITVVVAANAAPEITSHPTSQSVISGRPLNLAFVGSDPDGDSTALTWNLSGDIAGTVYSGDIVGTSPEFTLTAGNPGSGTLNVTVSDGTDSASIDINVEVLTNHPPVIVSADPGSVAIAGQAWEALVAVTDDNAGDLALLSSGTGGGNLASWMTLSDGTADDGRWKISGTPSNGDIDTTATFTFSVSDPSYPTDSSARASVSFSVTVISSSVQPVSGPSVPVSTPGAVTYASIHPGSSANLSSLSAALALSGRQRARGFWWSPGSGAYGELPASPADPISAGIFVASLDPLTITYNAPVQAAPYAIVLPANSWSFIGIPPIQLNAFSSPVTSHAWDDFRLETTAGAPLDESAVLTVLAGTSNLADIEPWSYDGTAYSRVATLNTGTAYWVRNRSGTAYRLVRANSGDAGTFGTFGSGGSPQSPASAPQAASLAQAPETPPAPPSGLASPASQPAQQADGGCGAGGLAGLFAAILLALGLRRRRN
jgi:hypothetical protein